MTPTLEMLVAIEDIKKLKARYFRLMDTKDWDNFAGVFTEGCLFDARGALEENPEIGDELPITGRMNIVSYARAGITPLTSAHYGHMPEIEILSATQASGIWALADILRTPDGNPFRIFYGYGHYHETYSKADGVWRIASLRITRLLVETEPR